MKKNIFLIQFFSFNFFINFSLLLSYLTIFFSAHLTSLEISITFMALYLTQAILEIPTGGAGDRFGNKKCLIVAILFLIIGRSILLYDTNFPIVIFSNIIIGIGLTFLSGCEESLFTTM
ncbi:MAG: hypothetical protein Ta2D_13070 [Rickettsiales bacterium]|nr:MAG: hypothetical protein Ta2D_13070 [Rickettsiales bacterium]